MAAAPPREHIVDRLIAERAPRLRASPAWPLARPLLYRVLGYRQARAMADAIALLGGREALDYVSALLDVRVEVRGLGRIPRTGRAVAVCNHPTGLADGVAVYDALKVIRPDLVLLANSDAHRVNPRLDSVLIPVEWVEAKRTRERTRTTLRMAKAAFEAERLVVIFPAGVLARKGDGGVLADPPWQPTALSLARRHGAPISPMHLSGPYSALFHAFDRVSRELRDITLFHEMLNKRGRRFALTIGPPIPAQAGGEDAAAMTARLQAYVERRLPAQPDAAFA